MDPFDNGLVILASQVKTVRGGCLGECEHEGSQASKSVAKL